MLTDKQQETLKAYEDLHTINKAADAIIEVMKTFNSTIENALPIILGTVNRKIKSNGTVHSV